MMKPINLNYYGDSDIGLVRNENQDSFGIFTQQDSEILQTKGIIFIIADGMGGHVGGKEASQLAIDIVNLEYLSSSSDDILSVLNSAFKTANFKINQSSGDIPFYQKRGTTCTAFVVKNKTGYIAHVGDTKVYKITKEKIEQLTNDHTQVEELLRKGILSKDEAKNHPSKSVLVRALGIESDVEVDVIKDITITNGESFLMCTDGLAKVSKDEIKNIVLKSSPKDACKKLIYLANESGGADNVTVIVIKVLGDSTKNIDERSWNKKTIFSKWGLIFLICLTFIVAGVIALIYKYDVFNISSNSVKNVKNISNTVQNNNNYSYADNILSNADEYLNSGKFDSALILYDEILKKIPMHAGALMGKEIIRDKYIQKGNKLINDGDKKKGVVFLKKALEQKPSDSKLKEKIQTLLDTNKFNSKKHLGQNENRIIFSNKFDEKQINKKETKKITNIVEVPSIFNFTEWDFTGLSNKDYKINNNGVTFLNSSKAKKIISQKSMNDIEFETDLKFDYVSTTSRVGIIIGFNTDKDLNSEKYFLFNVNYEGDFALLNVSNNQEEKIKYINHGYYPLNNIRELKIKVKCLGPWIILYCNDKFLESWFNKDFIKGKVGMFCEANTSVEFTAIKIKSAFKNK